MQISITKRYHFIFFHINLILTLLSLTLSGCKPVQKSNYTGYIIGVNNIQRHQPAAWHSEGSQTQHPMQRSVLITTEVQAGSQVTIKFCSGTLISPTQILTNHHCFAESTPGGKPADTLLNEACYKTTVLFGFTKDLNPTLPDGSPLPLITRSCAPGSLKTHPASDLALFALKSPPPPPYEPALFFEEDADLRGREAFILHYPDTKQDADKRSWKGALLPTASYTGDGCRIVGYFSPEEAALDTKAPYGMKHDCDIVHGSSGSALIDKATGKILGVHWGGIEFQRNSQIDTHNVATHASFAKAFIENRMDAYVSQNPALNPYGSSSQSQTSAETSKKSLPDQVKKSLCGTVSGEKLTKQTDHLFLLFVFFLPLIQIHKIL